MPALAGVSAAAVATRLHLSGLLLQTGPFTFRIRSPHAGVARNLHLLYASCADLPADASPDFGM